MASTGNRITRRHEAVYELDKFEAEIHRKDGFSRFQLPPSSADSIALARSIGGPIVAFSVSTLRNNGILVTQTKIKAIPLPGLDYDTLRGKSGILSNSVMKGPKRTIPDGLKILKGCPFMAMGGCGRASPARAELYPRRFQTPWQVIASCMVDPSSGRIG